MKTLKAILASGGYITSNMVPELAENFPMMQVVVKFQLRPRKIIEIKDLEAEKKLANEANDHVREVFISGQNFQKLAEIFGMDY
jgi:hypothetical protein